MRRECKLTILLFYYPFVLHTNTQTQQNPSKKSSRTFSPNVFTKSLYSETLDESIRLKVSAKALRSIDKAGGLDNYLFASKYVTEGMGKKVRDRIEMRMELDEKFGREVRKLCEANAHFGKRRP